MKTGRSLSELAAEIERVAGSKRDYVAKTTAIRITDEAKLALPVGEFSIDPIAHGQLAELTKIPKPYYDRLLAKSPKVFAANVNCWLDDGENGRMVRTLDGRCRALMSSAFRPLDNFDLANAIFPVLAERKLKVMAAELTERKLYIKAVDEALFNDVPIGHAFGDGSHVIYATNAPLVIISNSEVGAGRLSIDTGVYTKACTNTALWPDGGMKRTHVGARHKLLADVENIDALLSDKTKRISDAALWAQVGDVVAACFDEKRFETRCKQLTASAENKIEGDVTEVVELFAENNGLNDGERKSVLRHLIEGGSLSQYGLHAAVTRAAQDVEDFDRSIELEYLGGQVIELPRSDWQALAAAA